MAQAYSYTYCFTVFLQKFQQGLIHEVLSSSHISLQRIQKESRIWMNLDESGCIAVMSLSWLRMPLRFHGFHIVFLRHQSGQPGATSEAQWALLGRLEASVAWCTKVSDSAARWSFATSISSIIDLCAIDQSSESEYISEFISEFIAVSHDILWVLWLFRVFSLPVAILKMRQHDVT